MAQRISLAIMIALSLFLSSTSFAQLANTPWPMEGHDPQHTGRSPYKGPDKPKLGWRYQTENEYGWSPALGSDGRLYVGSGDGYVYALENQLTNVAPVLSGGKVDPENGDSETEFVLSVTYTDADNDGPTAVTVKLDNGAPVAMSLRALGHVVEGLVYEYRTTLPVGVHSYTFSASDGTASATGDVAAHTGPQVTAYRPEVLADSPWPMMGHDLQHTGRSPYRGPDKPNLKWSYRTGPANATEPISSPILGSDGTVYVGSNAVGVYALDPLGNLKWYYYTGGQVFSSPALGSDGTVYVGSNNGYVYALSSTGSLKWRYQTGYYGYSSPALGSDGTVYVGSDSGYVYALSSSGSLKWRYQTGDGVSSSPALGSDGTVYVGSNNGYMYVLSSSGSLKWRYQTGEYGVSSPALGSDGTAYVGSDSGYVYALSSTGSLKWRYQTGNHVNSSPALGSDGTVYVGSGGGDRGRDGDGYVYALSSTGSLKWRYQINGVGFVGSDGTLYDGVYSVTSVALGSDGTLYVGDEDGYVHAVENRLTNVAPVLSSGKVDPGNGDSKTEFVLSVTYTDADNDAPAAITVKLDNGEPVAMSTRQSNDNGWNYVDGAVYEYRTKLSPGTHSYIFSASDGSASATGDVVAHIGPQIAADKAPILSDGAVSPVTGNTQTQFAFSVTYTDADNDEPVAISLTIDGNPPVALSKHQNRDTTGDTTYVAGVVYEYLVFLPEGGHQFSFAASDGALSARGDTASHAGPQVELSAPLPDSPWPMAGHDARRTGQSPYRGPDKPLLKWKFEAGSRVDSPPVIGSDGTIYVGVGNDYLYALNPAGTLKWKSEIGQVYYSPAIGSDGTIYVASEGYLYALTAADTLKWKFNTGFANSSPAIGSDGTIYVASEGYLYALTPFGTLKWKSEIGHAPISAPAIGSDGTIYLGSEDGYLYAFTAAGILKWKFFKEGQELSAPAIGSDGTIYLGSEKYLYALNAAGTLKWKSQTGEYVRSSPAIGSDGTIYVGVSYYYYDSARWSFPLYAFNPDGILKWKSQTEGFFGDAAPIIGSEGTIYMGAGDDPSSGEVNYVYALDAAGTFKWKFETVAQGHSSLAIGSEGTIYVGSVDGYVYALGGGANTAPVLSSGKVLPESGNTQTQFVFSVTYTDADNTAPSAITVKLDSGTPVAMTKRQSSDNNYVDGAIYEYKATLSAGTHSYTFAASDGSANATGDVSAHKGLQIKANTNTVPVLSAGAVSPTTGNTQTQFVFSVTYTDADNTAPSKITVKLDSGTPVAMTKRQSSDNNYVDGAVYEYKIKLSAGTHSYTFAASDGAAIATGDVSAHTGLQVKANTNTAPVLSAGAVSPTTGNTQTQFVFSVTYTDADNTAPSKITVKLDSSTPVAITKRQSSDNNYVDGAVYEYKAKLSAGTHSYTFAASDGAANATGDVSAHTGLQVKANTAPVLSAGAVSPTTGNTQTQFVFSVTYTDADNTAPSAITVKLDSSTPVAMTKRQSSDNNYVDGAVYEYKAKLSAGTHTFTFAASDGSASATGDIGSHSVPRVETATATPSIPAWSMWGRDAQHTRRSPFKGPDRPRLKWSFGYDQVGISSSPAVGADGTVYMGFLNGVFMAMDSSAAHLVWSFETGEAIYSAPAIGGDGTVYFGSDDDYLYALTSAGKLKWRYHTGGDVSSSPVLGSDGTIYVGSNDGYLYALNPAGTLKWRYQTGDGVYSSPALGSDGTIYVGSWDNYVYALNPTGTLKWRYQTGDAVSSSPALASDGTVYVGSGDGYVYALNPAGTLKWRYQTSGGVFSSPALASDGTIYVGSWDGYVYALKSAGALKWRYQTKGQVWSSPTVGSDGSIYVGSDDATLYALTSSGNAKWCLPTGKAVQSSPAIGSDGILYVGSNDGFLYAIGNRTTNAAPVLSTGRMAPDTGTTQTDFALSVTYTDVDNDCPVTVTVKLDNGAPVAMNKHERGDNNFADGVLYEYVTKLSTGTHTFTFAASDGAANATGDIGSHSVPRVATATTALAAPAWATWGRDLQHTRRSPFKGPDKSKLTWTYQADGQVNSSPAVGGDGSVYLGSDDGYVYALTASGALKWRYQTGSYVESSPALGGDGAVYAGSYDGYVYALTASGSLKWLYQTGDFVHSSPALGSDGTVYVGSGDGYVYALTSTGTLKWRYQTGGAVYSSPALGSDRTVYVGSVDGYVYALTSTGALKWRYQTGGAVNSSPALGSDGTAYAGSYDGYVYALTSTGTLKWRYQTGAEVFSSPALGSDGTVYAGSYDGYVYAIGNSSVGKVVAQVVPQVFGVEQNYPNPFNPETVIRYQLPMAGQVHLEIYNMLGQKVRTLVDEMQSAGSYQVRWDGMDGAGKEVSSGVYFYHLVGENNQLFRKMLLVR